MQYNFSRGDPEYFHFVFLGVPWSYQPLNAKYYIHFWTPANVPLLVPVHPILMLGRGWAVSDIIPEADPEKFERREDGFLGKFLNFQRESANFSHFARNITNFFKSLL